LARAESARHRVTGRASREADLRAVTGIYVDHVLTRLGSFEIELPNEAQMGERRAEVLARGLPYLVAVDTLAGEAHALVGFAYAALVRCPRLHRKNPPTASRIPASRRRGRPSGYYPFQAGRTCGNTVERPMDRESPRQCREKAWARARFCNHRTLSQAVTFASGKSA